MQSVTRQAMNEKWDNRCKDTSRSRHFAGSLKWIVTVDIANILNNPRNRGTVKAIRALADQAIQVKRLGLHIKRNRQLFWMYAQAMVDLLELG